MTTATLTLTDFLLARIAEDETVARHAQTTPWRVMPTFYADTAYVGNAEGELWDTEDSAAYAVGIGVAEHIARHDPRRVLAECEAKRRIVAECDGWDAELDGRGVLAVLVFRYLAAVYADHADYREEWKP